jgi:hypothetical protein
MEVGRQLSATHESAFLHHPPQASAVVCSLVNLRASHAPADVAFFSFGPACRTLVEVLETADGGACDESGVVITNTLEGGYVQLPCMSLSG